MNPDAYMPYYGNDFEAACKSFRPETKWAYLCAIWHYWHHTHCSGLTTDSDGLRRICEVSEGDWDRIRPQIFTPPFFDLEGGLWHQKKCREIYKKWSTAYFSKVNGAKKAREQAGRVINPVINPVINSSNTHKSESESVGIALSPNGEHEIILPPGFPRAADQVKSICQMVGVPDEAYALHIWEKAKYRGGRDSKEVTIHSFGSYLKTEWVYEQQRRSKPVNGISVNGHSGGGSAAELTIRSKELERVQLEIKTIKDRASQDAFGTRHFDPKDKERLKVLNARQKELKTILGVTA